MGNKKLEKNPSFVNRFLTVKEVVSNLLKEISFLQDISDEAITQCQDDMEKMQKKEVLYSFYDIEENLKTVNNSLSNIKNNLGFKSEIKSKSKDILKSFYPNSTYSFFPIGKFFNIYKIWHNTGRQWKTVFIDNKFAQEKKDFFKKYHLTLSNRYIVNCFLSQEKKKEKYKLSLLELPMLVYKRMLPFMSQYDPAGVQDDSFEPEFTRSDTFNFIITRRDSSGVFGKTKSFPTYKVAADSTTRGLNTAMRNYLDEHDLYDIYDCVELIKTEEDVKRELGLN